MCNAWVSSRSGIKSDDYCDACGENCLVVLGCILIFLNEFVRQMLWWQCLVRLRANETRNYA